MSKAIKNAWRTAMGRTKQSAPLRWLIDKSLIDAADEVLDFGCGRGYDADSCGFDKYDPHFFPTLPDRTYDVVVCNYVLNVLPKKHEKELLKQIHGFLANNGGGFAYITVRRNIKNPGYTKTGTYQRNVFLDLPVIFQNSDYCIYEMHFVNKP